MEIIEVSLDIIIPNDKIGFVIQQPFVEILDVKPFKWISEKKNTQIKKIIRTLEIASLKEHLCEKTNFTIFPEYAIPGLEGVEIVEGFLKDEKWDKNTIVIAGIDGLTKDEYSILVNDENTEVDSSNNPNNIFIDQWINCGILWQKDFNGFVKKWIQPKLVPAWSERNTASINLFCGKSVYLFNCKFENEVNCYFLFLLCFDWIGQVDSNSVIETILFKINSLWKSHDRRDINFIYVIQNNDEPCHHDFLENARKYFEDRSTTPFINRDNTIILFSNTAGGVAPGIYPRFGRSAFISGPFSPYDNKGCPPTYAVYKTDLLRGTTNMLGRCKDAIFRENGECNHSIQLSVPNFMNSGVAGRNFIINNASVYCAFGENLDPRIPNKPVPATIKWINDQLNEIKALLYFESDHPLKEIINLSHLEINKTMCNMPDSYLDSAVKLAVCDYSNFINGLSINNVDNWNEKEKLGIETIIYSLSIMKIYKSLEISDSAPHALIRVGKNIFNIIIVSGGLNHEECLKYAEKFSINEQSYDVIITRDVHDTETSYGNIPLSILEPEIIITDKGPNITDPCSRYITFGYSNLKNFCFNLKSIEDLREKISEIIGL